MGIKKLIVSLLVVVMVMGVIPVREVKAEEEVRTIWVDTVDEYLTYIYEQKHMFGRLKLEYDKELYKIVDEMDKDDYFGIDTPEVQKKYKDPNGFGYLSTNAGGANPLFETYSDFSGHWYSPEEYEYVLDRIKTGLKGLNLGGKSDREVLKAASYWVANQIEYDSVEGVQANVYDTLRYGNGVCTSYAVLGSFVYDALGYECQEALGYTNTSNGIEGHMWNLVKLDGKFYELDPTWMDVGGDKYCLTDMRKDHFLDEDQMDDYIYKEIDFNGYKGNSKTPLRAWLIDIEDKNRTVTVGDKIELPKDVLTEVTSTDNSIVRVNKDNSITALKAGRVNITRKNDDYQSTFYVLVKEKGKGEKLTIPKSGYKLPITGSMSLKVGYNRNGELSYKSSNKSIATVTDEGKIVGKSQGKATITIKTPSGIEKKVVITVVKPSITGLKSLYKVKLGKEIKIPYKVGYKGNQEIEVTDDGMKVKMDGLTVYLDCASISKVTDKEIVLKGEERGKTKILVQVGKVTKTFTLIVE